MNERPFERHYGELRCRRYLFEPAPEADQTPRPEGVLPKRHAPPPTHSGAERPERPQ